MAHLSRSSKCFGIAGVYHAGGTVDRNTYQDETDQLPTQNTRNLEGLTLIESNTITAKAAHRVS